MVRTLSSVQFEPVIPRRVPDVESGRVATLCIGIVQPPRRMATSHKASRGSWLVAGVGGRLQNGTAVPVGSALLQSQWSQNRQSWVGMAAAMTTFTSRPMSRLRSSNVAGAAIDHAFLPHRDQAVRHRAAVVGGPADGSQPMDGSIGINLGCEEGHQMVPRSRGVCRAAGGAGAAGGWSATGGWGTGAGGQ